MEIQQIVPSTEILFVHTSCTIVKFGKTTLKAEKGAFNFNFLVLQIILVGSILFKNKLWLGQDFFLGGGGIIIIIIIIIIIKKNKIKYKPQAVITISFFPSMLKTTDTI